MSDFDLIDDPSPGQNAPEFTVSEISGAVKREIEGKFGWVRIRGEVGRVSRPRSGHVYLDLKDDRAVLASVMWKGVASRLQTQPEEGMEVVATGKLTTYPGQSKYQMVIDDIRPAGVGALMAMLEKRKAALAAEGLFAAERKQPIPFLPDVIGVVTSPSGAVIRDILHRLRDRFPRKVLIWPVAVQGERCAPDVTRAIAGFNALTRGGALPRPDLIIVARGGGSLEDLWGFNEESVVRAAADSRIPLISAVGHETDTTLIDFAADVRAPTPTAAAELAVPVRLELLASVEAAGGRMAHAATQGLAMRAQRLRDLARALPKPEDLVTAQAQRLDTLTARLPAALQRATQSRRVHLSERAAILRRRLLTDRINQSARDVDRMARRLAPAFERTVTQRRERLSALSARLRPETSAQQVKSQGESVIALSQRLDRAMRNGIETARHALVALDRVHQTVGYKETLQRGYAVVRSGSEILTTKAAAQTAGSLEIEFKDGRMKLGGRPTRAGPKAGPPEQGSLF